MGKKRKARNPRSGGRVHERVNTKAGRSRGRLMEQRATKANKRKKISDQKRSIKSRMHVDGEGEKHFEVEENNPWRPPLEKEKENIVVQQRVPFPYHRTKTPASFQPCLGVHREWPARQTQKPIEILLFPTPSQKK